jgi:hypothetical protein
MDSHIDAIMDHKMADVKDGCWFQSNATPRFSIGADSTSMNRVVHGNFCVPRMCERALASKKTTDPRRRPRPTVDVDMTAPQELPPASRHHPCRDMYEAGPIHRNKSSEVVRASEPMQTTADLMREIFGDGEVDDADSVLSMIRFLNIMWTSSFCLGVVLYEIMMKTSPLVHDMHENWCTYITWLLEQIWTRRKINTIIKMSNRVYSAESYFQLPSSAKTPSVSNFQ